MHGVTNENFTVTVNMPILNNDLSVAANARITSATFEHSFLKRLDILTLSFTSTTSEDFVTVADLHRLDGFIYDAFSLKNIKCTVVINTRAETIKIMLEHEPDVLNFIIRF